MRNSGFLLALAAVATLALPTPGMTGGVNSAANIAAAQLQSAKENRPVLVKFSTEW
jgi:hypothetical protein